MGEVSRLLRRRGYLVALAFAVVLLAANVAALPNFAAPSFWPRTLAAFAPFAVAAMASTPSIISGGIDISIGPLLNLVNVVMVAILLPRHLGAAWIAIPLLLGLGAGVGALNGVLVAVLRYQPVISTLCVYFVLSGLNLRLLARPASAGANWTDALGGMLGPLPIPGAVVTIGVPALLWVALRRTTYLKALYAVGGDDVTAFTAGVNVAAVRVLAYTLGGVLAAVAGIAQTALTHSADASTGSQYTLVALAAVTLGGTSLAGGRGGLACSVLGAACIFLIQSLLDSLHVSSLWLQVVYGALLLGTVVLGTRLTRGPRPREAT